MANIKEKTLSYRRAVWLTEGRTLESYLRETHKILKTVDERTVQRSGGQAMRVVGYRELKSAILIHATAETTGEAASIVPMSNGSVEVEVTTLAPPNDAEFMDGDAFMYISGNHVCICMSSLRDGAIYDLIRRLFIASKINKESMKFELIKIANVDKLKLLHSGQVSEVELMASVYQATADYVRRKTQSQGIISAAARQMRELIGKPNDVTRDGLQVRVVIKRDRRDKKNLTLGEKRIENIAVGLLENQENDDRFVIHLDNGQKISEDEIYVKTTVGITGKGKSVDRNKAWEALEAFYKSLKDAGTIEQ